MIHLYMLKYFLMRKVNTPYYFCSCVITDTF